MQRFFIPRLNEIIRAQAARLGLPWRADDRAPGTFADLSAQAVGGEVVVWAGASELTIFGAPNVNWAFRAWHDAMHLRSCLGFTVAAEIELGRLQAEAVARESGDLLARWVYCEVAEQAAEFGRTGAFVDDQIAFATARCV